MIITIKKEDILDPEKSAITLIGEQDAAHCDGLVCGKAFWVDGEMIEPGPHHHTTVRGLQPETSLRYVAVFPDDNS
jgi:hypothetical protein